jgi:hypothetical protein
LLLALNGLSLGRGDLSPDFYKDAKGIYQRIARQGISSYGHVHQRHFIHGRLRLSFHTYLYALHHLYHIPTRPWNGLDVIMTYIVNPVTGFRSDHLGRRASKPN